jgi:hypothetical protein
MRQTNGYIYIRSHLYYDIDNVCKIGKTHNIPERDTQYATGELKKGYFKDVYEVLFEDMSIIEKLIQMEFYNLNVKFNGAKEFYNKIIIELIEPYLLSLDIVYRKLTQQEISDLIRCHREKQENQDKKEIITKSSLIELLKSKRNNKEYIWNERDYQTKIINFSKNEFLSQNKLYIELPTGGGKSYIVYNLFEYLKCEFIIIVSPRKIVNSQNISQKYLQILKDNYITFNYSTDNNFDEFLRLSNKKIVICCTQSINKIYERILSNKIINITIWFDEAHWGIEDWINNINSKFWLLDNEYIKYRIFTSASPNKPKISQYEDIFGKIYSPITVKELIDLNWLSKIKAYAYSENKKNVNNINYILSDFSEKNLNFGFSFHNKQINAFNLFYKHYQEYKNKNTNIKPFLLISDNFTVEKEPKLREIVLEYNYRDLKTYETTIHSIGYVVAKYSMGYDFNKLDFMCLSDPKLSIQDIKQCIGRGIRPDELGINGSNRDKILNVLLPIYIDENCDNKYEKIIEVLKYLLYDIEIPFEEIEFKNNPNFKESDNKPIDYDGINDVKSILLDLLELENKRTALAITYEKAKKIIADKNIKSKESYYELCEKDKRLSKEPEIIFKNKFDWIEYLSIEKGKYYDLETCKNKIAEYLLVYPQIKKNYLELSIISNELCKIDELFPPNDLWVEFYKLKNLQDLIIITNNNKKLGVAF